MDDSAKHEVAVEQVSEDVRSRRSYPERRLEPREFDEEITVVEPAISMRALVFGSDR
jgi:hypothetical protein